MDFVYHPLGGAILSFPKKSLCFRDCGRKSANTLSHVDTDTRDRPGCGDCAPSSRTSSCYTENRKKTIVVSGFTSRGSHPTFRKLNPNSQLIFFGRRPFLLTFSTLLTVFLTWPNHLTLFLHFVKTKVFLIIICSFRLVSDLYLKTVDVLPEQRFVAASNVDKVQEVDGRRACWRLNQRPRTRPSAGKTCVSLLKRFVLSQHAPVPLYQKQTSRRRDLGQTAADREQTEAADQQRYRQPHLSIRESVRRPIKSQNKVSSSSSSDAVSSS